LAVSTFCKKCNTHLKIEKGVAIAHQDAPIATFAKQEASPHPESSPNPTPPTPISPSTPPPVKETKKEPKTPAPPVLASPPPPTPTPPPVKVAKEVPPSPKSSPPPPDTSSSPEETPLPEFTPRKAGPDDRIVRCFECDTEHPTSKNSTSALCPRCGAYISLKDFDIKDGFNSRIQTRGTVIIHKKGVVSSSVIQCHNLTVEGEFTGAAECSGDLTIRRHSRIQGHVSCDVLRIEKRAKVEFLKGVKVNTCEIDGQVEGNVECKGRLALHKKATLIGDIKVGSLSIDAGAKHQGQISMGAS